MKEDFQNQEIPEGGVEGDRDSSRKKQAVAATAAFVTSSLIAESIAKAQAAEPFGDDVNGNRPSDCPVGTADATAGHLMPGVLPSRLRMTFAQLQPAPGISCDITDVNAKEFEIDDAPDGGIIMRGLGPVMPVLNDPLEGENSCLEITREDGRVSRISDPSGGLSGSYIDVDGAARWDVDGTCAYDFVETTPAFHPTATPGELKINVHMPTPNTCAFCIDNNVFRVNIDEPDYCHAIADAVLAADAAGQTPYQADLLNSRESHSSYSEISSPETDRLLAVTRVIEGDWRTFLMRRNPEEDPWAAASLTHLQRNEDGTWTVDLTPASTADPLGTRAWSMLKRETPSGREVTLFVYNDMNPDTDEPILKVLALEESSVTPGTFIEVPITMEDVVSEPDDDGDGRANSVDDCQWRANPGGVDVSGPTGVDVSDGTEDACQANCEAGGWPGVDPAGETNASGLRVCESELGYANAFTDEDGSTFHSNADVVLAPDGAIALQPGQTIRYIHSNDPRADAAPSRDIRFPGGNSVHLKIHDTSHLDGSPASATLQYRPYEGYDPLTAPVTVTFDDPTAGVMDYPVAIGAELGLEGSDVEVTAGEENLPMDCPPICAPVADAGRPPDSGTPDAATPDPDPDANTPDASTPDASMPDASTPDASTPDASIPDATTPDANIPDAPTSDVATPDASQPDAGILDAARPDASIADAQGEGPEAGRDGDAGMEARLDGMDNVRTDMGEENPTNPGCHCTIAAPQHNNAAPLSLDGNLLMLPLGFALLRKHYRNRVKRFFTSLVTPQETEKMGL